MATGDTLTAAKAQVGAIVGALAGFVAPGITYLLTVDGNGITPTEWRHAVLLAVAAAATTGAAVGGTVYAVENKPKRL